MKPPVTLALLALALLHTATPTYAAEPAPQAVTVSAAWARATPPGMAVAAVYLTLSGGPRADRLVGAATPRAAMAQIEAIAAVEGVDGVFIGPNDLAADMGYLGNWQHPEVWKVMEDAAKRITKAGKAPGILVGEADGQRCLDMGYLFVAVGSDLVMLARGSEALAAKFRK